MYAKLAGALQHAELCLALVCTTFAYSSALIQCFRPGSFPDLPEAPLRPPVQAVRAQPTECKPTAAMRKQDAR
jgi:hypothetical protein